MTHDAHTEAALGRFIGDDLDRDTLDELQARHISQKFSSVERELFGRKWFDYRFMHPTTATYLFAHCYKAAVRDAYRTFVDAETADDRKGLQKDDMFELGSRGVTGIWRARQHADLYGVPYRFWCRKALGAIYQAGWFSWPGRPKWMQVPMPQNLYGDLAVPAVCEAWSEETSSRLIAAGDARYGFEAFQGNPHQVAHEAWLVAQLRKRARPEFLLARLIYVDRTLREETALAEFGPELVAKAAEIHRA
jgi:hypothetical protein